MKEILDQNQATPPFKISILLNAFAGACLPFLIELFAILFFPFYFDKYQFPIASFVGKIVVLFSKNINWILVFTAVQFFLLKKENLSRAFLFILISALLSGCTITFLSYYQIIERFTPIFYENEAENLKMHFWYGAFWGARIITLVLFCFLLLCKILSRIKNYRNIEK